MNRLIQLLRACQSDSVWGHSIRANIDRKPDELIDQLRSQTYDSRIVMESIIGTEAVELLINF